MKFLKPTTLKNRTVLLRVDVNVPINQQTGAVADAFRIEQVLPTVRMLLEGGNKLILCGHLRRPTGRDASLTLRPVAQKMAELLGYKFLSTDRQLPDYPVRHLIFYTGDLTDPNTQAQLKAAPAKDIIFLENLRFYPGEEKNDLNFSRQLAGLANAYVNEAFSVSHRAAASIVGVPAILPHYGGPLLEREIKSLTLVERGKHPFVVMMGGIKISDKVATLKKLGEHADSILIGGGLANCFFGQRFGNWLI